MLRLALLAGCVVLCGCDLLKPKEVKAPPPPKTLAEQLTVGCYTVDLFDPYRLEFPAAGVTRENSRFIGVWKDAAWNGEWCHDLYVTEVRPDGSVTLLDAYGPYAKQNREATIFKRKATIKDGVLAFSSLGGAAVTYKLSDDGAYLIGRRVDALGKYEITMARHDGVAVPPIPPRKPKQS